MPDRHAKLKRFRELVPPNDGADDWRAVCRGVWDFVSGDSGSIMVLIGERGTGKTQIACTAIAECLHRHKLARYISLPILLADLKARYGVVDDGDKQWLEEWTRPYFLVLDEFAEQLGTDWARLMLTALIDNRYGRQRPTLLIANTSAEAFNSNDVTTASIRSRCQEGGGVIVCDWSSYREGR